MKKVVSLFLALLMIFSVAAPSFAVSATELAEASYASDVNAGSTPDDAITDAIEGVVDFFTDIFNKIINFFKKLFGLDNGAGKYKIVFNTDGGNTMNPMTVAAGDEIPSPDIPYKTGHTFIGWSPALPEIMPKYDIEVKALWSVNKYTVNFDSKDGTNVEPITQNYGTLVEKPSDPVKSGFEFKGWYDNNGDLVSFPFYMPAANTKLTARWLEASYSIVFKLNATDKDDYYKITGKKYNEVIKDSEKPADPVLEGHTFVGWSHPIPEKMPSKNMVIVAVWAEKDYTVSFIADGKILPGFPITEKYGTLFDIPSPPVKEGYDFIGWGDKNGNSVTVSSAVKSDATYYAIYKAKSYNIYWNIDSEKSDTKSFTSTMTYGSYILPATAVAKEGYVFKGWDKTVPEYMPAQNLTFSAVFEAKKSTITFVDGMTGREISSKTYDYNSLIEIPATPVKEGYSFTGWDQQIPSRMPARDLVINANFKINQYTITFVDTGDVKYPEIKRNYGEAIEKVKNPTKVGYTFLDWDKAIPSTMPASNITITAKWQVNQYTVTFDTNGGTAIAPVTQNYGSALKAPAAPVKSDYEFIGWAKVANPSVEDKITLPSTIPAEDVTYYAIWRGAEKTVIFNANDPDTVGNNKASFDTSVAGVSANGDKYTKVIRNGENLAEYLAGEREINNEMFPKLTKTGFAVLYWSTDSEYKADMSNKVPDIFELSASTESVEYWAHWVPAYTIALMDVVDGNVEVIKSASVPEGKDLSEVFDIDEYTAEKRKGYTFDHWEYYKDGAFVEENNLPKKMPARNLEYYASWDANKYVVVFDAGEGTFDEKIGSVYTIEEKYTMDIAAKLPDANRPEIPEEFEEGKVYVPVREGFVFEGWTTEEGLDYADVELLIKENKLANKIAKLPTEMPLDGAKYYAMWSRLVSKAIYMIPNVDGDEYIPYEYELVTPNESGVGEPKKEMVTAEYATKYGTAIRVPEVDPTRNGYQFMGWFDSKKADEGNRPESLAMPAKDIIFYARFAKTYSFDFANCGNVKSITAKPGDSIINAIKALEPTKKGHRFMGWKAPDGTIYANNSALATAYPVMPDKDMTFVAQWEANKYTIKFNTDGGTKIDDIVLPFGSPVEPPVAPTKQGYTFEAWVDGNGNNVSIPATMPENGFECTAKWKVNQYKITFDAVDGLFKNGQSKAIISVNYGDAVDKALLPEAPVKYGHIFDKWEPGIPVVMPAEDLVVTATYTLDKFTATFYLTPEAEANGDWYAQTDYDYGAKITKPANPSRAGYVFEGWSYIWSEGDANDKVELGTITADISFYAIWVPRTLTVEFTRYDDKGKLVTPFWTDASAECGAAPDCDPTIKGTRIATVGGTERAQTLYWTIKELNIDVKHGAPVPDVNNYTKLTYIEHWVTDKVTITFNSNGGSSVSKRVYESGDRITIPENPTKEGFVFDGWVYDDGAADTVDATKTFDWYELDENKKPTENGVRIYEDTKLEAVWSPDKFYVIWNVDGEKTKVDYEFGADVVIPAKPEKEGYIFAGWTPAVEPKMGAANVMYTATWTPREDCKAIFNAGEGAWADGSKEMKVTATFGETIEVPVAPARTGYTFGGWSPAVGVMDKVEKTFTAIWNAAGDTLYTVETYIMTTDSTDTAPKYDKTVAVLSGKTGETVMAQYTVEKGFMLNSEKEESKLSGVIEADGSLVLKVYIDRIPYNVTINGKASTYLYGQTIAEPTRPTIPGTSNIVPDESFEGWFITGSNTEVVFPITATMDIDVVSRLKTHSILFVTEGADGVEPLDNVEVYSDLYEVTKDIKAGKDGYDFIGWTDVKGSTVTVKDSKKMMPNNDITLYPVWKELPKN